MTSRTPRAQWNRFLAKPWPDKRRALLGRLKKTWNAVGAGVPLPVRLPWGMWWLAIDDVCSDMVFSGRFEPEETAFVSAYLRPGMTVVDVGAHHGFYTMLASRRVGSAGRVVAFEPSARERARLTRHLRLNRCANVTVEPYALGAEAGTVTFYCVEGRQTGMGSLRPPDAGEPTRSEPAEVRRLDDEHRGLGLGAVDFVKIDAEGGELDVLRGATELLVRRPRPVILAEISDRRTAPWAYRAREVLDLLAAAGFRWHALLEGGRLAPLVVPPDPLHANLVAVPDERRAALAGQIVAEPAR